MDLKKFGWLTLSILFFISCTKNKNPNPFVTQSIADILGEAATLNKVTEGFDFTTAGSPLWFEGSLYFTNNNFDEPEESRTYRLSESGEIDTLRNNNGVTTTLQASGNRSIFACEMLGHRVVEMDGDGTILNVVADRYNGIRIDGPNDIVVDGNGGFYFSDSQFIAGRKLMQDTPAVYYVSSTGFVNRVADDLAFPNGLALSPDGKTLYVANTQGTYLVAYSVLIDGSLTNKRDFAELEIPEGIEISGADGMASDIEGNLYVATTQGLGIQIFNSNGDYLGNIDVPTATNNVTFGGVNNQTIFISAQDGIYSIPAKIKGLQL